MMNTMFKPKGIDVDGAEARAVAGDSGMSEAEKKKMTILKDTTLPMALGYVTPDIMQSVLSGNGALPPASSPQAAAFQDLAKRLENAGVARPIRRVVQSVSTTQSHESSSSNPRRDKKRQGKSNSSSRSQQPTGRRKSRADESGSGDDDDDDDFNGRQEDGEDVDDDGSEEEATPPPPRRSKRVPARSTRPSQQAKSAKSKASTKRSTKQTPRSNDDDDEEEYITNDSPSSGDDDEEDEKLNKQSSKRNLFDDDERAKEDDDDDEDEDDNDEGGESGGDNGENGDDEEYVPPPRSRASGNKRTNVQRSGNNQRGRNNAGQQASNRAPNGRLRNNKSGDGGGGDSNWRRYCCCCGGAWLFSLLYALLVFVLIATVFCLFAFGVSHAICRVGGEESSICFGWASPNSILYGRSIYLSPIDGVAIVTGTIWNLVPSVSFSKSSISIEGFGGVVGGSGVDSSGKSPASVAGVVAAGGVAATGKFLDPFLKNRFEAMVSAYKVPAVRDGIAKRSAANAQCLASLEDNTLFVLMQFIMAHRVCDFVDERSLAENVATFFGPLDSLGSAHAAEFVRQISQYPMRNN